MFWMKTATSNEWFQISGEQFLFFTLFPYMLLDGDQVARYE